jgi:HlyD family secretion protein
MVVSGDVTQDQRTGVSFYTVRIGVSPEELARLGEHKLVPGMPVEIFIQTTVRTVISFFVRPFQDQIARAFREK